MTIESLIRKASEIDTWLVVAIFIAPPVLIWIVSVFHRRQNGIDPPWNYIYSFFVYLVCVPGMFSCVLTAYSMFFVRQNLLQVNFIIYFFPILGMIVTLVIVKKNVNWDQLPGIDRLYALMILIAVSFAIALAIQKSRIWIFFGGSIGTLLVLSIFFFALLKWGMHMLFRSKDERKIKIPSYSEIRSKRREKPMNAKQELRKFKKKLGIKD